MAGNSSNSDSSSDWTLISYEEEDIIYFGTVSDVTLEPFKLEEVGIQEEAVIVEEAESSETFHMTSSFSSQYTLCQSEIVNSQSDTTVMGEIAHPAVEETKSAVEAEEETPFEDIIYFETVSDVTLEPPKLEEVGIQEEAVIVEAQSSEIFHMASSFSGQYTFCEPEIAFSSQHNDDESRSDEIGHQPSPAEEEPPAEQEPEPCKENLDKLFSNGRNNYVIIALVISILLQFGYIYVVEGKPC